MTPVVPCSISSILLFPGTALAAGKANSSKRCYSSRKSSKHTLSYERFILPPSTSVSLFSRRGRSSLHHKVSASETDVAASESESPVEDASEIPANGEPSEESSGAPAPGSSPAPARRFGNPRKSAMEPIKNEDLILGATFRGEVRSIQPFGAFVDIGAFTDGLVHVSRLSDGFVKDVGSIVSVGQEVKVTLVEVDLEKKRIGLSMLEGDDGSRPTQPRAASSSSANSKTSRKGPPQKTSKFSEGESLVGTVKNLTKSGAFISLPGGGEGFLPKSEEGSSVAELAVGKEVTVQVLRFDRGRVTLTMKIETGERPSGVIMQTEVYVSTNPFMMAFRKNEDIAMFLDEREKQEIAAKAPVEPNISVEKDKVDQIITGSDTTQVQEPVASIDVGIVNVPVTVDETAEVEEASSKAPDVDSASNGDISEITASSPSLTTEKEEEVSSEILSLEGTVTNADSPKNDDDPESIASSPSPTVGDTKLTIEKEEEVDSEILAPEGSISITDQIIEESPPQDEVESDTKSESSEGTPAEVVASESPIAKVEETQTESVESKDELDTQAPASGNEVPAAAPVEEEPQTDSAESKDEVDIQAPASGNEVPAAAPVEEEPQTDSAESKDEVDIQAPAAENEVPVTALVEEELVPAAENEVPVTALVEEELASLPEKDISVTSSDVQPAQETKASISPALVKQLREESGAGMMDCKNALLETEGDIAKAQEFLRKKGLASAEKKASRTTAEGRIGSYIHDGRIGVLVEVNCETDFVSRGDIFKELVEDLAMQVAACPQVQYVDTEDVPEEIVNKEKDIEMQKEDLLSKPEQMRSRIVEGRIKKMLGEMSLLEQPYIKNDKVVVKDWVKQTIATVGENMKVKRFVRFNLGEGLEKKSQDFAAEVAAQTAAKPVPAPEQEQSTPVEAKESVETRPPAVAVSAALVKQLRDETGAGMMDCKKALSETEGDLERAQEYLRKKGLSSADKKSSRLAAEGRIGSYIHDSRIGVLIEVNCETDFVGRSEKFKELVDDLAMQVVANPLVQYVSIDDIPASIVLKEKELEMQRDDLQSKPESIREKIVEGRVLKRMGALALLEQPFIKDDSVLVKDLVKQTVAAIGENIKVRRFVKFTLGET